jgi:WD40 repeat protein
MQLRPIAHLSAHDNTKFVSSGGDRSVFLWDVTTGNTIRRISAHLAKINVVEFNGDASVMASGQSRLFYVLVRWSQVLPLLFRFLRFNRQTVGSSVGLTIHTCLSTACGADLSVLTIASLYKH